MKFLIPGIALPLLAWSLAVYGDAKDAPNAVAQTACAGRSWCAEAFDARTEFPNYFIPSQYRSAAPDAIPEAIIRDVEAEIEKAVRNTASRITIPTYNAQTRKIEQTRIIPFLEGKLQAVNPQLEIHIPGRDFRSIYSYVYREIYQGMGRTPPLSPADTLKNLQSTKRELPALQVFGVNGRFNLLLDGATPAIQEEAARSLEKVLADTQASKAVIANFGNAEARLRSGMGAIDPYGKHIANVARKGGSSIDWLSFSTKAGKVHVPPQDPASFDNLVRGIATAHAPPGGKLSDVALAESFAPLTELPYLQLSKTSDELLVRELTERLASPTPHQFDPAAREEIRRLVRRSFPGGANNRLLRTKPNSSENLFYKLSLRLGPDGNYSLIPRFAPFRALNSPAKAGGAAKSVPQHLLMPVSEFLRRYTDDNVVYHGTSLLEDGVSIFQQGPFLAEEELGAGDITKRSGVRYSSRAEGTGVYSTPDRAFASRFAKLRGDRAGIVLPWMLDDNPNIRIMDWTAIRFDPWVDELTKKTGLKDIDLFDLLSSEYHVDLIYHEHPLIQNAAILRPASDLQALKAVRDGVLKPGIAEKEFAERIAYYSRIRKPYAALYGAVPELPETLAPRVFDLLTRDDFAAHYGTIGDLMDLLDSWGYEAKILAAVQANPRLAFRISYASLDSAKWTDLLKKEPLAKHPLELASLFGRDPEQGLKALLDQKEVRYLEELLPLTGPRVYPDEFDTWRKLVEELGKRKSTRGFRQLISVLARTTNESTQRKLLKEVIAKGNPVELRGAIRELIQSEHGADMSTQLLEAVFSRPESAPLKEEFRLLLEKNRYLPLHSLVDQCFSKPHSAAWADAFTYLVKTRVDNYEPAKVLMGVANFPHSIEFAEGFAAFLQSPARDSQHFYGAGAHELYSALQGQPHWRTPTGRLFLETRELSRAKTAAKIKRFLAPGKGSCVSSQLEKKIRRRP